MIELLYFSMQKIMEAKLNILSKTQPPDRLSSMIIASTEVSNLACQPTLAEKIIKV